MVPESVGVIGLGLLGSALAQRLVDAGYRVVVHNRTREKAVALLDQGARWSDNPLAECSIVVVCLYTTDIVEQTLAQLGGFRPDQIVIDATTGEPSRMEALGQHLAHQGVHYLEAPIAASSDQTRRGEALAMVAGAKEVFDRAYPVLSAMAPQSFYVGVWGNAARMKLVNNLILGLTRAALAEGLAFAQAIGIDKANALQVLRHGNAYSVVMDVKGDKMVQEDFTTQAKLSQHLKDVRLILAEAEQAGLNLPLSLLHRQLLEQVEQAGWGELDNSVIIKAWSRDDATT